MKHYLIGLKSVFYMWGFGLFFFGILLTYNSPSTLMDLIKSFNSFEYTVVIFLFLITGILMFVSGLIISLIELKKDSNE